MLSDVMAGGREVNCVDSCSFGVRASTPKHAERLDFGSAQSACTFNGWNHLRSRGNMKA